LFFSCVKVSNLVPNSFVLAKVATPLFGGVVFVNAESVTDYTTNKFTTILPAAGLGMRLKINKVSKVNFALDYAWGVGGSHGFFFNLAEVF
jgi:hypothetical protein